MPTHEPPGARPRPHAPDDVATSESRNINGVTRGGEIMMVEAAIKDGKGWWEELKATTCLIATATHWSTRHGGRCLAEVEINLVLVRQVGDPYC